MLPVILATLLKAINSTFFMFGYVSSQNSFPQPLTTEEEGEYLELFRKGDEEARNILIERNLRLVAHIVKKYAFAGNDCDDLISIGTIGLIKAISTFNQEKGARLATYAARCIENDIPMIIYTHIRSRQNNIKKTFCKRPFLISERGAAQMRIIALSNQKGGVAKSTTVINTAAILGEMGYRVLVVDMDPQANATIGLGMNEKLEGRKTVYECLVDELPIDSAVMPADFKNVFVAAATLKLANAELEIASVMGRECLLKESMAGAAMDFDYALLDLPPNLGLFTINGLVAATEVIIPVDVSMFAISGVNQLVNVIRTVKKKLNPALEITGALLTKADGRTKLSKEVKEYLKELFGDRMFKTVIHQNVRIAEAQKAQVPITYYDPKCAGAREYVEFTKEVVGRVV